MRRRILFALEITIFTSLILISRCANYRDVFADGQIYFTDADCYARMTRARICFEHPGTIIRHHDFENFPVGTPPHTTAPFDYLIVALAKMIRPFAAQTAFGAANGSATLDLAGAIVSPLIAVATGIFLSWWTRRMQMRFRFALLLLFAVSPILAHGTELGRPDHQSMLIGLITIALCAEWTVWEEGTPGHPEQSRGIPWRYITGDILGILRLRFASLRMTVKKGAAPQSALQRSGRAWDIVSGATWALAIWVSLYEPLVLFALTLIVSATATREFAAGAQGKFVSAGRRNQHAGRMRYREVRWHTLEWWIAFIVLCAVAILIEGRFPAWPASEFSHALRNWGGSIGELARVPIYSRVWFEWCSWLLLLAPVLFWWKRRKQRAPLFLIILLVATFALTMMQARWGYFFALIFALLAPATLSVIRKPPAAAAIFLIALFPIAQAWDASLSEPAWTTRAENQSEQMELRAIASQIDGALLAPWWFSPALAYWSREPAVGGSSHESISGIVDCALFYSATEFATAADICRKRGVKWVVSYDSDRVAENSGRILGRAIPESALCFVLDRHPSAAPSFLKLVRQTARFKLYRVEGI